MDNTVLEKLKFNAHGLIPAVVIDADDGKLLMVAYMNRESLDITLREGYTCFWSRSRSELWRKGETSGNRQKVVSITADCDYDTLEVKVHKLGPACHTGAESCFFNELKASEEPEPFSIQGLYELLLDRKAAKPEGSYTSYLFEKGLDKILKKVGEESTEVIIAAHARDKRETVYELADLAYHALVLMAELGITPDEVRSELAGRHIIDHKVKQEKMT